ncbi:hypothetical protein vBEliSR6L_18 [Erythrobacter phage vB_EliS_R6L]|nr:hypothetical protein vBEliSR6L_18 [Erythrobacter phage vB_EliS_R6L]
MAGNRYGRNQKRQHREEIARLGKLADDFAAREAKERSKRLSLEQEMIEWAGRIASLLGPESAFARDLHEIALDPAFFDAVAFEGRPLRMEPRRAMERVSRGATLREACEFVDLFATTATPERDEIAYRWRFLIRGKDGALAMMMDERTLYTLKAQGDRALIDYLTRQLVQPWLKEGASR